LKAEPQLTLDNGSVTGDISGMDMTETIAYGFHMTSHAIQRSQQRCIPPLIIHWLCQYGSRKRSRNGTMLCYFDRKSLHLIASDVGRIVIRRLSGLMNAYLVIADNQIITVGHRYKRIKNL